MVSSDNLYFRKISGHQLVGDSLNNIDWGNYKIVAYSSPKSSTESYPDASKIEMIISINVDSTKLTDNIRTEVIEACEETLNHLLTLHSIKNADSSK